MFDYVSDEHSFWFWPFVAQQCLATMVPLALLIFIVALFRNYNVAVITVYMLVASSGFLLGYIVGRLAPQSVRTGRWVWVIPASLLLIAGIDQLTLNANLADHNSHPLLRTMEDFFNQHALTGLPAMVFGTIPALSSACYTLGSLASRAKRRLA